ncbi:unnamed protein product [Rangifer tarandus platyrhynchus]|uniref:Uncharacterized protein n=1 Tax=Rangifer tarandus platyrhynchus TaxID=3082113 RepID=A0ABN8ZLW5_RANTA|nr:unnamed protein product [Rangifer tarandus platyrhynchus]
MRWLFPLQALGGPGLTASGWDSVQAGMYTQATEPPRCYVAKWVGGSSTHSSPGELSQGWSVLVTGTQRTRATGWAKASAGSWPCSRGGQASRRCQGNGLLRVTQWVMSQLVT